MAFKSPADPAKFDEAVKWFRARLPMTDDEFAALDDVAHERAFTISGVRDLQVVTDVYAEIDKAIENGTPFAEFKKAVQEKLTAEWGSEDSRRIETIFRTNVQTAYSRGRKEQLLDPQVLSTRPFWIYDATLDSRTTDICRALNGTILPADDSFWGSHSPPNHFNCRSQIRSLRTSEAKRRGISEKPSVKPQKGFDSNPSESFEPTKEKYPQALWSRFEEMQARRSS